MNDTIIIALISFAGTVLGTAGGIFASGKLVNYRIEQLEKKVDALAETSAKIPLIEERIKGLTVKLNKKEKYYENYQRDHRAYGDDGLSGA